MATGQHLRELALLRLQEAAALFHTGLYNGCWYLCGYVIELAWKARICRAVGASAGVTGRWNWKLRVSAGWAEEKGKYDTTHLIAHALHDGMDSESQIAISRVTVLNTDDPFVRDLTFLYPVPPGSAGVPIAQV